MPNQAARRPPERRHLPDERRGRTWKLKLGVKESVADIIRHTMEEGENPTPGYIKAYLKTGEYDDGSLGEIFTTPGKEGSLLRGLLDGLCIVTSIALQYGVPLEVIVAKFIHARFGPQGPTNDKAVPMASSILDLMFRKLALAYLSDQDLVDLGIEDHSGDDDGEEQDERPAFDEQPGWVERKVGRASVFENLEARCFKGEYYPDDLCKDSGPSDPEGGGEARCLAGCD